MVSTYSNGGSFETNTKENGRYELITLKSIDMQGKLISSGRYIDIETPTLKKDTLVMILSEQSPGLLGMTAKIPVDNKYVLNQRVAEIRPNKEISSYFLSMAINKNQYYFSKCGAGTKVQNISKPNVEKYAFSCPKKNEQTQIGSYFQHLDKLISLHQTKVNKLTNLKIAMLEKMFPKQGADVPEIRFKGFDEAWDVEHLSEIATMKARIGWQGLTKKEYLDSGYYYLITGTDFDNGKIDFKNCHYVNEERYIQDINIQIKNDDVLITKDGTIGKVAYVDNIDKPATLNAGVFVIRGKDESISNLYLYHYLAAPFLLDFAYKQATGGTIKHLNQNVLVKFPVLLGDIKEQAKIGSFFQNLDKIITLHQTELEKLNHLKKAFLENMFV